SNVVQGSNPRSLHLQDQAADVRLSGNRTPQGDQTLFNLMKTYRNDLFDHDQTYEVILHRPPTATNAPHVHVGRYSDDHPPRDDRGPGIWCKVEGGSAARKGKYEMQFYPFPVEQPDVKVPDGKIQYDDSRPRGVMEPARVGGVSLAGAGAALKDLGPLTG